MYHDCENCGLPFEGRPNKVYCGVKCALAAKVRRAAKRRRDERPVKACAVCGTRFTLTRPWRRFCCDRCRMFHNNHKDVPRRRAYQAAYRRRKRGEVAPVVRATAARVPLMRAGSMAEAQRSVTKEIHG